MGQQPGLASILISYIFQELWLTHNQISKVHPLAFKGLNALETLYISFNRLTAAPSIADVRGTLKTLGLSNNYIKHISDTYFDSCMNVINIDISYNLLMDIPNMRDIARTLRQISLEGNNISSAQPLYGFRFPKLYWLQLAKNHIRTFCFPPLKFVPSIRHVYLSSNNLSRIHLPRNSLRPSDTIILDLSDNPWNCNDSLGWIQHCSVTVESHLNLMCMGWLWVNGMICSSPKKVQGLTPKEAGTDAAYHLNYIRGFIVLSFVTATCISSAADDSLNHFSISLRIDSLILGRHWHC